MSGVHPVFAEILRAFAEPTGERLREFEVVTTKGGREMVVLATSDEDEARDYARRLGVRYPELQPRVEEKL